MAICPPAALMDIADLSHCGELNCRLLGRDMGHTGSADGGGSGSGMV